MPEQVTFEKVKMQHQRPEEASPRVDSKKWLEWLLRLSEYFAFMGYSQSDDDQLDFVEDIQVLLLHDDDLMMFNDIVGEEQMMTTKVAIHALRRLIVVHCPPRTRALIMAQLVLMKKLRTRSVREYARNFRKLLRMIQFLEENEPVLEADVVCMFKNGMPVDWQQ
ncbi:hypothetical protein V7S43_009986 [Phytophthora oleae]|uniref:Retrotransposon gag domain-containing protein n=1 Tax=Phytophthora oleae TaxID=2107226 RepID=A0ABD3FEH2_9STRA